MRACLGNAPRPSRPCLARTFDVQILRGTYSLETYFADGDTKPVRESVLVSWCLVGRYERTPR